MSTTSLIARQAKLLQMIEDSLTNSSSVLTLQGMAPAMGICWCQPDNAFPYAGHTKVVIFCYVLHGLLLACIIWVPLPLCRHAQYHQRLTCVFIYTIMPGM